MALLAAWGCSESRTRPDGGPAVVSVHPAGILDAQSDDFHVRELIRHDWDFAVCARCHGDDFTGGTSGKSCRNCHPAGPTACETCHGPQGPISAAHIVHRTVGQLACSECHVVPATWDAEGHIRQNGVAVPPPAKVVFGARAGLTIAAADRAGPPTYAAGVCTNIYCHGAALHRAGGTATAPRWDDPAPAGACDRCHGAPPPSHAQARCASCHPSTAPHIDGVVQIGRTAGCDGCHGDASSPAPPTDLTGNTLTTAIGVGAHRAHLAVPTGLRGPIACATCHRVPTTIGEVGHIDSPPPAEVVAAVGWDRASETCATACHGAARPVWTTSAPPVCGSCHGVPPSTPAHAPDLPLSSCTTCHPNTVDASGRILLTSGPGGVTSAHMNGVVDAP